jgi:hypothetical protein
MRVRLMVATATAAAVAVLGLVGCGSDATTPPVDGSTNGSETGTPP